MRSVAGRIQSLALLTAFVWAITGAATGAQSSASVLAFDPASHTTLRVTVDGVPMEVRRYRVVYVAKPVRMAAVQPARGGGRGGAPTATAARAAGPGPGASSPTANDPFVYQTMYVYVPDRAYDAATTAIILQVNNGGWFASPAQDRIVDGAAFVGTNDTDNTGAALKAGYVIVSAGTRSRGIRGDDGSWAGKAPAVIVDAKAAVRYLRFNDAVMPGSAERIVITGTSGGGALSVAVAASGNSPDFFPELAAIGAAGIDGSGVSTVRDDVFGTIAYCPITDLGHSDIAYEWQFGARRTSANTAGGQYPAAMQDASEALAAAYPAYLQGLHLTGEDGALLTAATLPGVILAEIRRSVEAGIARGAPIPTLGGEFVLGGRGGPARLPNDWLRVENGRVAQIDYTKFLAFVASATALKRVPAFDATASTGAQGVSGENTLFGSANVEYANFTEYAWNHNEVKGDGSGPDDTGMTWSEYLAGPGRELARQIRLTNPLSYLNSAADTAPYWYVRHGLIDRDTSFAIEVALSRAVRSDASVRDVNFRLAWLQGHAGNYDVQEAYGWLANALRQAGPPAIAP